MNTNLSLLYKSHGMCSSYPTYFKTMKYDNSCIGVLEIYENMSFTYNNYIHQLMNYG